MHDCGNASKGSSAIADGVRRSAKAFIKLLVTIWQVGGHGKLGRIFAIRPAISVANRKASDHGDAVIPEREGIVENAEAFNQYLIVERDPKNPNRLSVLFPPDLVNQLRVFALLYQFRLQYPDAA